MAKKKSEKQAEVINLWTEQPNLSRKQVATKCGTTPSYVSWIKHTFILGKVRIKRPADPDRKKVKVEETTVEIQCIGPGKPHTFHSTDPRYNRLCKRCQEYAEKYSEYAGSTRYRVRR